MAKRASIWAECWEEGVRRCFLVGGPEEVGIDWGIFSDIFGGAVAVAEGLCCERRNCLEEVKVQAVCDREGAIRLMRID